VCSCWCSRVKKGRGLTDGKKLDTSTQDIGVAPEFSVYYLVLVGTLRINRDDYNRHGYDWFGNLFLGVTCVDCCISKECHSYWFVVLAMRRLGCNL